MNGWILILVYSLLQRNGFISSFRSWKEALGESRVGAPWAGGCICVMCTTVLSWVPPLIPCANTKRRISVAQRRTSNTLKVAPGCGCDVIITAGRDYKSWLCPALPMGCPGHHPVSRSPPSRAAGWAGRCTLRPTEWITGKGRLFIFLKIAWKDEWK